MASIQPRGDKFQLRVKHKLLAKPFIYTFDSQEKAESYGQQLEMLLAKGIVPQDLLATPDKVISPRMVDVIDGYVNMAPVTSSDTELLTVISKEVVGLRVSGLTYPWVESWVRKLKVKQNLAPGTIRKRVESLARVLDWHLLKTLHDKSGNPLRMLPTGYSSYSDQDIVLLPEGREEKTDIQRDRRLTPAEYGRCLDALQGIKHPGRQRALDVDPAFILLLDLILGTGLRLMEAFRLRWDQVDFKSRVILVEGTKGHRGKNKPRNVPMRGSLMARLEAIKAPSGLAFPFWDGTKEDQKRASKRLSVRFGKLFDYAGVEDCTEHDLRHEAACRWFELRRPDGAWHFSDIAVCKIMGWSDYSMILRYASLRGEDLAEGLE